MASPNGVSRVAEQQRKRPVVSSVELRESLYANRRFPALLFATSGRFSAGEFRERADRDNRLRI